MNAQNMVIPLWEKDIPNSKPSTQKETANMENGMLLVREVQKPDITVYLPSIGAATGEAVIICPGGGYWVLAYDWEGMDVARALNAKGIAAIVLKYRLPTSKDNYIIRHKSPLLDAQRAMRMVRYNAKKWNIDTDKIGIMGFSAGGHLAATLSNNFDNGDKMAIDSIDKISCRPDFSVLIYPVISCLVKPHQGSVKALLGENPSKELLEKFSNEMQVTEDTPPTFLVHSTDDDAVPVKNSLIYYEACHKKNVPVEMHIYPYGGHGYSLALDKGYLSTWIDRCTDWIKHITKEEK